MVRKLALLVTALIVIADVVLISVAVQRDGSSRAARGSSPPTAAMYAAPEMILPTRIGTSTRTSRSTSQADVPWPVGVAPGEAPAAPMTAAAVTSAPELAAARGATAGSEVASDGLIEVLGESRSIEPEPPLTLWPPDPPSEYAASGRVILAVRDDGTLVRAVRGSCPATSAASLYIVQANGAVHTVRTDLAQVLQASASADGLRLVGTDFSCRPTALRSVEGLRWQADSATGWWYPSPDSDARQVVTPNLVADVGCLPLAVAGTGDQRAFIACADGAVRITHDAGDSWSTASVLPGLAGLAWDGRSTGFALSVGAGETCAVQLWRTGDSAVTWAPVACLDRWVPVSGQLPTAPIVPTSEAAQSAAVAASGHMIAVQVGSTLVMSRDSGVTWHTVGR